MPVILLRFFRCALLHDPERAEITKSLDSALIRQGFYLAAWLWNLWLNTGLASLNGRQLDAIPKVVARREREPSILRARRQQAHRVSGDCRPPAGRYGRNNISPASPSNS